MCIATEIVTFKITEGIAKEEFISIVDGLEKNFHSQQLGFIDTELLYNDKTEEWIMIQHWDSKENMQSASKRMFNNPITATFVNAIIPNSVKMLMLPQLGTWAKKQ
jgi:hypothetical protein